VTPMRRRYRSRRATLKNYAKAVRELEERQLDE